MAAAALIRLARHADGEALACIYRPAVEGITSFEATPPDGEAMATRVEQTLTRMPWLVCELDGARGRIRLLRRAIASGRPTAGRRRSRPTSTIGFTGGAWAGLSTPRSSRCSTRSTWPRWWPASRCRTPPVSRSTSRWASRRSGSFAAWASSSDARSTSPGSSATSRPHPSPEEPIPLPALEPRQVAVSLAAGLAGLRR